jgi:60 kDa SS-A/Ro ribonucleoprotein
MCSPINGGVLSCREASAAMANVTLRTEEHVECVAFCDKLTPLPFKKDMGVQEMVNKVDKLRFGTTDCGLPMMWAKKAEKKFDVFIVYTDNETWAGKVHPFEVKRKFFN